MTGIKNGDESGHVVTVFLRKANPAAGRIEARGQHNNTAILKASAAWRATKGVILTGRQQLAVHHALLSRERDDASHELHVGCGQRQCPDGIR